MYRAQKEYISMVVHSKSSIVVTGAAVVVYATDIAIYGYSLTQARQLCGL